MTRGVSRESAGNCYGRLVRTPDPRLRDLVDALRLVAAEPEVQRGALGALRVIASDIARGEPAGGLFDVQLARDGVIPPEVAELVAQIDASFDELVERGIDAAWTAAALRDDPRWATMRALARRALALLGAGREPPP